MEQLIRIENEMPCTTSRLVAEKFGKNHRDVLKSIRKLDCSIDFTERNFAPSDYTDPTGRKVPEFIITRDGFTFLVMGFTGKDAAGFKEEYINAFNEAERQLREQHRQLSPKELAMMVIRSEEEKERVMLQLNQAHDTILSQAPKVEYANKVLNSESAYTTTTIAKELGMSAPTLNQKLKEQHVQYYTDGHWVLYSKYEDKGYTKTRTHTYYDTEGQQRTAVQTVWTERGRQFIHGLLNTELKKTG